jgi:hypothetical protein
MQRVPIYFQSGSDGPAKEGHSEEQGPCYGFPFTFNRVQSGGL